MRRHKRTKPPKGDRFYRQLWRIVDGAVIDAFAQHPDYLSDKGTRGRHARISIVKRVTGAILGYTEQSVQGRSGYGPAAESGAAIQLVSPTDGAANAVGTGFPAATR